MIRVFGKERFAKSEGTSHEYQIQVPELQDLPEFQFGHFVIPVKQGQQIKAYYLQKAYRAAVLTGLCPPAENSEDNDEQDNDERNVE